MACKKSGKKGNKKAVANDRFYYFNNICTNKQK